MAARKVACTCMKLKLFNSTPKEMFTKFYVHFTRDTEFEVTFQSNYRYHLLKK